MVISSAEGAWLTDVDGRRYLDCLAGYSALNFGHRHPQLIAAAHAQLDRLTLTSRAFIHDQFADFCRELAELCGKDLVLPMNTGAEAVETGDQGGPQVGLPGQGRAGRAGRTSWSPTATSTAGPPPSSASPPTRTPAPTSGRTPRASRIVPYGDLAALAAAIDENTVAVLLEPIQGEQGVVVPPEGYLPGVRRVCTERNVLFIADEIQSGLGRTGATFACDHEGVVPDMYLLGKALGGGIVPVSAVAANARRARRAASPASTARPSAATRWPARWPPRWSGCWPPASSSAARPSWASGCTPAWTALIGKGLVAVRGRGLWAGLDIDPALMTGREAVRAAGRARRPRQGHPRLDHPAGPAAGDHRARRSTTRWPSSPPSCAG